MFAHSANTRLVAAFAFTGSLLLVPAATSDADSYRDTVIPYPYSYSYAGAVYTRTVGRQPNVEYFYDRSAGHKSWLRRVKRKCGYTVDVLGSGNRNAPSAKDLEVQSFPIKRQTDRTKYATLKASFSYFSFSNFTPEPERLVQAAGGSYDQPQGSQAIFTLRVKPGYRLCASRAFVDGNGDEPADTTVFAEYKWTKIDAQTYTTVGSTYRDDFLDPLHYGNYSWTPDPMRVWIK